MFGQPAATPPDLASLLAPSAPSAAPAVAQVAQAPNDAVIMQIEKMIAPYAQGAASAGQIQQNLAKMGFQADLRSGPRTNLVDIYPISGGSPFKVSF
jgi:hypothetical protein